VLIYDCQGPPPKPTAKNSGQDQEISKQKVKRKRYRKKKSEKVDDGEDIEDKVHNPVIKNGEDIQENIVDPLINNQEDIEDQIEQQLMNSKILNDLVNKADYDVIITDLNFEDHAIGNTPIFCLALYIITSYILHRNTQTGL
jgi:hypothetical protein